VNGGVEVRLAVGGRIDRVPVVAREKWNWTGVHVEPGEHYTIAAAGRWTDLTIDTDAEGFLTDAAPKLTQGLMRKHEKNRRMPAERWFCLVGCVGERGTPFRIGAGLDWPVPAGASGILLCFANDVPYAYWNNRGALTLTVTRTA
jgi:hypothetical protein